MIQNPNQIPTKFDKNQTEFPKTAPFPQEMPFSSPDAEENSSRKRGSYKVSGKVDEVVMTLSESCRMLLEVLSKPAMSSDEQIRKIALAIAGVKDGIASAKEIKDLCKE